jgi:hypothetical protein
VHEREPDAEPALHTFERRPSLGKRRKQPRLHIGRDADAVVANGDQDLISRQLGRKAYAPPGIGILGRVDQQIAEDLRQPYRVSLQRHDVAR